MKTQMNWKRGSLAYGDNLLQAPQLKKENFHIPPSAAINEYPNTMALCRSIPNKPCQISPSGFVASCSSSSLSNKRIPIASIEPGYTPPKFSMNPSWLVAAGEDSQECVSQRNRESKVQEAIYRHKSSIPLNPIVSMEVQHEHYDDSLTPIIPLIPIEELEIAHSSLQIFEKPQLPITTSSSSSIIMQQQIPSSAFPNTPCSVNKAASDKNMNLNRPYGGIDSSALTVLLKNGELPSTIDTDLLFKILSDPKMIGALLNNSAAEPPFQRKEEYYKKLIRQHGAENNILTEKMITHHLDDNNKPKNEQKLDFDDKGKKRCRFFNSKSGCRNGVSCLFLHEAKQPLLGGYTVPAVVEEKCAKRLRVS